MKTTNTQLGIGTGGGALLSVLAQLGMHDMVRTAVLAAIGAAVSFAVTWALQRCFRKQ
ncbi:MAG TPA: hypothetical protein VNQ80_09200 [Parapedobacter sp.]|uniref:hypothetical protein n=1 Tax=Parapedobacter sp. TaxID=1958893 RepID=UPI002C13C73B|nr:hypothetical protein [Parapedobacter sp.]HWK57502.1 hypothetical protein [Parapedobacter sp.]